MADIVIGTSKDVEIFVRDSDGDQVYSEGERIGVRVPGDRFESARVEEALGRVGISRLIPGVRLHRIGAYMDYIREADALASGGDFLSVHSRLEQAMEFAADNGIAVDESRLSELAWRAVDNAVTAHAEGLGDLNPKDFEILRRDDDPGARLTSAQRILDYLSTRASIVNVERSAGPGRARMLEELETRASDLSSDISARARRIHTVLVSGSRMTTADQADSSGTVFRIGDRVRYRDPDTGDYWEGAFVITSFELRADGVVAHGTELRSGTGEPYPHEVNLGYLTHVPEAEGGDIGFVSPPEGVVGFVAALRREVSRFLSLFR